MNANYENRDFYLTAYLMASGFKLTGHSRSKNITTFIFEDTESLQDEINKYLSMQALVEPMAYGSAQRALKSVIHSTNTNTEENTNVQQSYRGR